MREPAYFLWLVFGGVGVISRTTFPLKSLEVGTVALKTRIKIQLVDFIDN